MGCPMATKDDKITKKWLIKAIALPIVIGGLGIYGAIHVAEAQYVEPGAMYCVDLRDRILLQLKSKPSSINARFPDGSQEQRQCDINSFMEIVAGGSRS